jgi:hypothetical protein
MFQSPEDAQATEAVISDALMRLRVAPEFKFNGSSNRVRDEFFAAVKNCAFLVRAIVVRKGRISSPRLVSDKDDFYRYCVRQMMTRDDGRLSGVRAVIDGSADRMFKRTLKTYLRRHSPGGLGEVRFGKSRNDPLLQLADMCAGAIARSYRTDRADPWRWRDMLRPRIENVWEFP